MDDIHKEVAVQQLHGRFCIIQKAKALSGICNPGSAFRYSE